MRNRQAWLGTPSVPVLCAVVLLLCLATPAALGAEPWSRTGPDGGDVYSFVSDPLDPGHLFAAIWSEGLFESFDYGETWAIVPNAPPYFTRMVFDPFDPHRIYGSSWGLMTSADSGKTWGYRPVGEDNLLDIDASPRVPGLLYVASYEGAYCSKDHGLTWTLVRGGEPVQGRKVTASATQDGAVFTNGSDTTYRSEDYGVTWKAVMPRSAKVVFSRVEPKRGMALSANSGVYTTSDGGATWSPPPDGAPAISVAAFDPQLPGRAYGMRLKMMYQSNDWGQTWTRLPVIVPHLPTREIVITGGPRRMFVTFGGYGVFEFTGPEMVRRNRGLSGLPVDALFVAGDRVIAGTYAGGSFIRYPSGEWRQVPDSADLAPTAEIPGEVVRDLASVWGALVLVSTRGYFRSTDRGNSWQELRFDSSNALTHVAEGSFPGEIFATRVGFVMRSVNGGTSWTRIAGPFASKYLWELVYDKQRKLLFTARNADADSVYRSPDSGLTWTDLHAPFDRVTALELSPQGTLYAAASQSGVFRSEDGGDSWTRVTDQSESWMRLVTSIAFDPADAEVLLLGTEWDGAFASFDRGTTFVPIDALAQLSVNEIVRDGSRWIFATNRGVYIREDPLFVQRRRSTR